METLRDKNGRPHAESGTDSSGEPTPQSGATGTTEARRQHVRNDVGLEVTMESETNFYMGLTENLSEGGLFIATHELKPLGTQIEVSFKLPGAPAPIKVTGTVRWLREYSPTSDTSPGMGVRFEHIDQQGVEHIRRFLAARAPLFHDED